MDPDLLFLDLSPQEILQNPLLNKGTAFPVEERDAFHLHGFLPSHILDVQVQIARSYENLQNARSPLEKFLYLMGIFGRNELLFYQLALAHIEEILPIIYTPTVGEAAINYSRRFFEQRGLYLSYPLADRMEEILSQYPQEEVSVIVVTDGERILGLGDQGIGGMTIPIGKLSLYTLFGGVDPRKTLPIFLDVGTNNLQLLQDPKYLGWHHQRVEGKEYEAFLEKFVVAIEKRFPRVLLQWEDFGRQHARLLLDRYRERILSFNDDIQGTSAVVVSAILAALHATNRTLRDERFVLLGAGSAGLGIADGIVLALQKEGLSLQEAQEKIYLVDQEGLLYFASEKVYPGQERYVKEQHLLQHWTIRHGTQISLFDCIVNVRPAVLIGVSAQGGAFTKEILDAMCSFQKRPIVLPLSNPTAKAECTAEELLSWTHGEALVATGSPFPPVTLQGKTYKVSQCNNVYIFPGLGAGAIAVRAQKITDAMLLVAAEELSRHSPLYQDPYGPLFPPIEEARAVSKAIAIAVAKRALQEGVGESPEKGIEHAVQELFWTPHYPTLRRKKYL